MQTLVELLDTIKNSRHWLQTVIERCPEGSDASGIVAEKNRLAIDLFAVARFHYGSGAYEEAIPYIEEAHQLVGASLESSYFLMHCLSELGRWDEAYSAFRESRKHSAAGYKHPLYIDPDITLANLKGLGLKVVEHCERLQKPVNEADYQDWHWNKRFLDYREFTMIAEGYYPPNSNIEVMYHPFEFRPYDREFQFHGLTDKGVPFKFDDGHNLAVDSRYPAKVKHLLTRPQSHMDKEDAASWLEVSLISSSR